MRVHAIPGDKIVFEGPRPKGYYQTIGVTAVSDVQLLQTVRAFVLEDTGGTLLEVDDFRVPDLDGSHRSIRRYCGDLKVPGVWYISGWAFYHDDDAEGGKQEE